MPRNKRHRKICDPPPMLGFKPFGIPLPESGAITLTFDEFESIRLLDYELLTQEQASAKIGVSRPTLTRIYENARRIIARAFVEGKAIVIRGGTIEFDKNWFRCKKCYKLFDGIENHKICSGCSDFSESELICLNDLHQ